MQYGSCFDVVGSLFYYYHPYYRVGLEGQSPLCLAAVFRAVCGKVVTLLPRTMRYSTLVLGTRWREVGFFTFFVFFGSLDSFSRWFGLGARSPSVGNRTTLAL